MNKRNLVSLALTALIFSSCQVKVDEAASSSQAPSFDGIWSTDCMVDGSDSYIRSVNIENGTMTSATIRYQGTTVCDQAMRGATIMHSGALTLSGDHASIVDVKNFELQLSIAVLVLESSDIVTMLNTEVACGLSTWTLNQAEVVFGCEVGGGFDYSLTVPNTTDYGVYKIDATTSPYSLQFGTVCNLPGYDNMCPSLIDRPTTVSGDVYFKR